MATKKLDGELVSQLLKGGVIGIRSEITRINELNVFPVPDGDTGTNMTRTLESGLARACENESYTVSEMLRAFSTGALFGARGNSGVILSQFIAGACDALMDKETIAPSDIAKSMKEGVSRAYSSIAKPVEGTILTVLRECGEYAEELTRNADISFEELFEALVKNGRESLERTKDILPVLREADVVDSGGAGFLCIIIGMQRALLGEIIAGTGVLSEENKMGDVNYDLFTTDSTLEWGYCTECLVRIQRAKCDPESFERDAAVEELEALGCNSIVLLRNADVLKLHAHTFKPQDVLSLCQRYGEFLNVKIENMSLQHSEKITEKKKPHKKYALVSVAMGEGMATLFRELGADATVGGGQCDNPSTEDFVRVFDTLDADNIIVLPNNGNILLAAKQAAELYEKSRVTVLATKSIPEGYAAISVYNPSYDSLDSIVSDINDAIENVVSVEIAEAIRNVTIGGVEVKRGEYIGVCDGELVSSSKDAVCAVIDTLSCIDDIDDREILTVFVGEGVGDDERTELTDRLGESFPMLDVQVYIGGQDVYDYIISVE